MSIRISLLVLISFLTSLSFLSVEATAGQKRIVQSANMNDASDPFPTTLGAALLTRGRDGVEISLHFTDLEPFATYTTWWIVFNKPDDCTNPCDFDDLESGVGQGFFGTGYIAGAGGTANVYTTLAKGPIAEGRDRFSDVGDFDPRFEVGLRRPLTAELHMITARNHGPAVLGVMDQQVGTLNGGCDILPGGCFDVHAVVFRAPDDDS